MDPSTHQIIRDQLLAFAPLFFAINSIGVLPVYLSLTTPLKESEKEKLLKEATLTAFILSFTFLVGGKAIFSFLGITADDFRIGGGLILLLIALSDLIFSHNVKSRNPGGKIGIVPVGSPLIIGPAALTTILATVDRFGYLMTVISLLGNLLFVYFIFHFSHYVVRLIGKGGTHALGKIFSLFLCATAVMMIRMGLTNFLKGH